MKIVRSIVAVVVGWVLSGIVIFAIQMVNTIAYAPGGGKPIVERMEDMKKMTEDPQAMKAYAESLPVTALLVVLLAWQIGVFIGGGVSALIAGRAQMLHAGIIGGLVLAATVFNFINMKRQYDFSHPDWMIIAALLLPLPASLLAGKLVSLRSPSPPASNP